MPRSRNIKHAFFTDDELADQSPLGRLLFIGMWTIANYRGNLEYRPKRLKAELLPYDDCDIDALVTNLDQSRFITIYSVEGKTFIHIRSFLRHQSPHPNEKKKGTLIPPPPSKDSQVIDSKEVAINPDLSGENQEQSPSNRADSCSLIPDNSPLHNNGPVPTDFKPTDQDYFLLRQKSIPKQFVDEQIIEFIAYWSERNDYAKDWRAKFRNRVIVEWLKEQERNAKAKQSPKAANGRGNGSILGADDTNW